MTEQLGGGNTTDPQGETSAFRSASSVKSALADTQKEVVNRIKPAAADLMARGRELVDKGNERRFVIEHDNRAMVDLPLTIAAAVGFVVTIVSPAAAVLGVLAALFTRVRVRIEGPDR